MSDPLLSPHEGALVHALRRCACRCAQKRNQANSLTAEQVFNSEAQSLDWGYSPRAQSLQGRDHCAKCEVHAS